MAINAEINNVAHRPLIYLFCNTTGAKMFVILEFYSLIDILHFFRLRKVKDTQIVYKQSLFPRKNGYATSNAE